MRRRRSRLVSRIEAALLVLGLVYLGVILATLRSWQAAPGDSVVLALPTLYRGALCPIDKLADTPLQEDQRPLALLVVVPFVESQLERVLANLQLWRQNEFAACVPADEQGSHANEPGGSSDSILPGPVDLLFYYNHDLSVDKHVMRKLMQASSSLPCFRDVVLRSAYLSGAADTYSATDSSGPANMFYDLLLDDALDAEYHALVWLEPDVAPVRTGWLRALHRISVGSTEPTSWMKGSIHGGNEWRYQPSWKAVPSSYHINGNAVYSLRSSCFRAFLRAVRASYPRAPFDVAIHAVRSASNNYELAQATAHRFVYTNVIRDLAHRVYTVEDVRVEFPGAYLVHSNRRVDV